MRQIKFRGKTIEEIPQTVYFSLDDIRGISEDNENILLVFIGWQDGGIAKIVGIGKDSIEQFTGLLDKNGKEIYEGDIVRVYDTNRYCICSEWEDCKGEDSPEHKNHGEHKHEKYGDCEMFVCTQEIAWSKVGGYFSDEELGDFCPPLGAEEIFMEIIGNIYENPELLQK